MSERDPVDIRTVEHRGRAYLVTVYLTPDELGNRALYEVARRAINARQSEVNLSGGILTLQIQGID